jgi:hypothetical protein
MNVRFVRAAFALAFAALVLAACGGKIAGDDDASPVIPTDDTGVPDFTSCGGEISPSWSYGCDGSAVAHGQLCATPALTHQCLALESRCDGPSPDEVVLSCDPGFFSRPGAKIGIDVDPSGCVTSIVYSLVDPSVVECALDRLSTMRFPCEGSTTMITPCKPFH